MIRGLYCAAAGMDIQQAKVDSISNNLANASTPGFKKENIQIKSFPEVLLGQQGGQQRWGQLTRLPRVIGTAEFGVQVASVSIDYTPGPVQETGKTTDVVIKGPGFFAVNAPVAGDPGRVCYTRNGAFRVDSEGYLTAGGYRVLGEKGPIMVGDTGFKIARDGTVESGGEVLDRLQLVEFADANVLYKEEGGIFVDVQGAGGGQAFLTTVGQGYLEMSNVNVVDEMVDLVSVVHVYEANQRLIQAHDEQLAKAVNQVGSLR
jgi:flagellar basal-body rod protein FlgF